MFAHNTRVVLFGAGGVIGGLVADQLCELKADLHLVLRRRIDSFQSRATMFVTDDISGLGTEVDHCHIGIICLGTTLKQAGSKDAFYQVDVELVDRVAKSLKVAGTKELHVVSSLGADAKAGSYYLRSKAEMESRLTDHGFETLVIYRPSLFYGAKRQDFRLAEMIAVPLLKGAALLIPALRKWKPMHVENVAAFIVSQLGSSGPGVRIIESLEIGAMQLNRD
ncbi:hypothetical protein HW115_12595 [Verrucomicrobiaceae bacterium N1E253]|uniref:NAD(P)-binding domain-containing protein n=1 Tax=Oceaniferula marina TaxID=2748318 RepID=A0A851GG11_9BACT|nr:hypothetical protein [Oceaniferula marina]NWK56453.1 hypothetical protein [Oceaniferula marina]